MTTSDLTRRAFGGAALLGMGAPVLAACGSDGSSGGGGAGDDGGSGSGGSGSGGAGSSGGAEGDRLVAASEVPVGGGVVLSDAQLVVTQPAGGEFKCFSAICTHQGCTVGSVENGEIHCPCHGSRFSAEDGSVLNGPATTGLEEVPVSVEKGEVVHG